MRPQIFMALAAMTLSACAPFAKDRTPTYLPNGVTYGRHLTISTAVGMTVVGDKCGRVDPTVLSQSEYNYLYHQPDIVHSKLDEAVDSFIANGFIVCRYVDTIRDTSQPDVALIARFKPSDNTAPAMLFLGSSSDISAGTAFWVAAEAASNMPLPWGQPFYCVTNTNASINGPGDTRCYTPLTSRSNVIKSLTVDGLRGLAPE